MKKRCLDLTGGKSASEEWGKRIREIENRTFPPIDKTVIIFRVPYINDGLLKPEDFVGRKVLSVEMDKPCENFMLIKLAPRQGPVRQAIDERNAKMLQLRKDGHPTSFIAEKFNLSRSAVWQGIKKAAIRQQD